MTLNTATPAPLGQPSRLQKNLTVFAMHAMVPVVTRGALASPSG